MKNPELYQAQLKISELKAQLEAIRKELEETSSRELTIPLETALNETTVRAPTKFQCYVDGSWDGKAVLAKILLGKFF